MADANALRSPGVVFFHRFLASSTAALDGFAAAGLTAGAETGLRFLAIYAAMIACMRTRVNGRQRDGQCGYG